jgi:hypothetical protein
MISAATATVITCDDASRLEEVNPATGVPDRAYDALPDRRYLVEILRMVRLGSHWAVSAVATMVLPDSLAEPCQPLPAVAWLRFRGCRGRRKRHQGRVRAR